MIVTYFVMRSDAGCTFLSFNDALNVMHVVYQTLGCKQVLGKKKKKIDEFYNNL